MRKIACLLPLITLVTLSNSFSCDSIRMGLSLGGAYHSTKAKNIHTSDRDKFIKSAPSVGFFLGYDHLISETPLFFGGEIGINNHNSEKTRFLTGGSYPAQLKLKTNNSFTGSIRLGIKVNDTLLYVKWGASSTNWQTRVTISKNQYPQNQRNYQNMGYIGGFGLESRMSPNFSIGIEHEYTFNNEIKNLHPNIPLKLRPIVQTTGVRLIYNF